MDGPLLILPEYSSVKALQLKNRLFILKERNIDREKAEQYYQQNLRELKG